MQFKSILLGAGVVGVVAFASGCNVNTPTPPGGPVSYTSQIQPIFDNRCSDCHRPGGVGPGLGIAMLLTPDDAPASLINKKSSVNDALTLVIPGDAANSLLYQMVSQSMPPVGIRMPPLAAPLSGQELGLIRDWINQGAEDN